ncbi:uncharacterized protein LOC121548675 [Coregonus clupeaformis]|uniref:uncharacterized protein LOC121548675 n=1 Tax=Coregonus clupeaformis TaxID=59861 RepID=UPI001E1C64AB|nr:uncharacterized protein LOC121548675 [Coregonus clupeaformis]
MSELRMLDSTSVNSSLQRVDHNMEVMLLFIYGTTPIPVKTTTSTQEQSKTDGPTLNPVKTTTSTQKKSKTDGPTLNPVKTTTSTQKKSKTDGATLNPVKTTTSTQEQSKTGSQILIFTVAVVAVVCVIAAVIIVRRRREKNQVPNDNSIVSNKDMSLMRCGLINTVSVLYYCCRKLTKSLLCNSIVLNPLPLLLIYEGYECSKPLHPTNQ